MPDEHKVSLNADSNFKNRGRSVAYDMKQKKFDLGAYYETNGVARGFMLAPDVAGAYKKSRSMLKSEKKGQSVLQTAVEDVKEVVEEIKN